MRDTIQKTEKSVGINNFFLVWKGKGMNGGPNRDSSCIFDDISYLDTLVSGDRAVNRLLHRALPLVCQPLPGTLHT